MNANFRGHQVIFEVMSQKSAHFRCHLYEIVIFEVRGKPPEMKFWKSYLQGIQLFSQVFAALAYRKKMKSTKKVRIGLHGDPEIDKDPSPRNCLNMTGDIAAEIAEDCKKVFIKYFPSVSEALSWK